MSPEQIKALRERLGWTQARLATYCGVTARSVKRWEQGTRTPTGPAMVLLERLRRRPPTL